MQIEKLNSNLWNIYMLFTKEPYVKYLTEELEFYALSSKNLIGVVSLDLTDQDYSALIFSRDGAMQYRAIDLVVSKSKIEDAREWLFEMFEKTTETIHDPAQIFDLFDTVVDSKQLSNKYEILNNHPSKQAAKKVIQEIGFHYKDIDGNFIQQFQSKNGFDARFWEIFLYCLFREEGFGFNRNSHAPDYMIQKFGVEIAVEAVIISDTTDDEVNIPLAISKEELAKKEKIISKKMENEMPLKFSSSLYSKLQKKYWEHEHVKGKSLVIAIADFHEFMSMSWSQPALIDLLYGYRYDHKFDINGDLVVIPKKIEAFVKETGVKIPAGFFNQQDAENISAVLVSSTGTIGKFNRMGIQAELGSEDYKLYRQGTNHNFEKNAVSPNSFMYEVTPNSREKWTEGAALFHNPNAKIPVNPELFPTFGHYFIEDEIVKSILPDFYPYNSMNLNLTFTEE